MKIDDVEIRNGDTLAVVIWKIMSDGTWYTTSDIWEIVSQFGFNKRLVVSFMITYSRKPNWFQSEYRKTPLPLTSGVKSKSRYYKLNKNIPIPIQDARYTIKYRALVEDELEYKRTIVKVKHKKVKTRSNKKLVKKKTINKSDLRIDQLLTLSFNPIKSIYNVKNQ